MPNDWLTLADIGKFSIAIILIRYVVEYTKNGVDRLVGNVGARFGKTWHVPTMGYAYLFALALLVSYHIVTHGLTATVAYLDLFNAFVATLLSGFMKDPSDVAKIDDKPTI